MKNCTIDGCDQPAKSRGWCHKHYMHWHTYGEPVAPPKPTTAERLLARIIESEALFDGTPCWEWQGLPAGYGYFSIDNRKAYTHRTAWETFVGPIPEGFFIDHLCENKPCCNPQHLEPVPPIINTRRAASKTTHCPRGHAYDEANTRINAKNGGRQCRACQREQWHERKAAAA